MSEMSAEKKKEIEKYIIKSYFGGGKNVESLANGADTIKGTDDGCIPQLIVEVTYFGESGIVMIKWNIYGDSQQNSFSMRICREREIERNRCDSVDSMVYAWEAWKSRILNKPIFLETNDEDLQKDKRIEELERAVKALKSEKEVMERHIQELESHNVSLAETNAVLNNKLNKLDPMPDFNELLKKLYYTNDVEKLEWALNHACGDRGSVNGWIAVSLFWKQNYETLSKLVGFSSVEEIQDYLTNEAECDTLQKAIASLEYNVKFARDERRDLSKKLEECEKDYISERDMAKALEADISDLYDKNKELESQIEEWKDKTERCTPYFAGLRIKVLHDSYIKYKNLLFGEVRPETMVFVEGKKKTIRQYLRDCDYNSAVDAINRLESEISEWRDATGGCLNPHYAKIKIDAYDNYIGTKLEKKD